MGLWGESVSQSVSHYQTPTSGAAVWGDADGGRRWKITAGSGECRLPMCDERCAVVWSAVAVGTVGCMRSVCMEREDRSSVQPHTHTGHTAHTSQFTDYSSCDMCRVRVNSTHKNYLQEESGSFVPFDQT